MIRYELNGTSIEDRINSVDSTWLKDAKSELAQVRKLGRFYNKDEGDHDIWGRIKRVYRELQSNKCAYCERDMTGLVADSTYDPGSREHDVEHFRPKGRVRKWPTPKLIKELQLDFEGLEFGTAATTGYHLLAFHPLNYATACATCNQSLKADYFPVAGKRDLSRDDPTKLADEYCYLIYPIGELDEKPEDLIGFDGIVPVPAVTEEEAAEDEDAKFRRDRARVTIAFFLLGRAEHLRAGRSRVIGSLYTAYRLTKTGANADRKFAEDQIRILTASKSPHTSCARAYLDLLESSPKKAKLLADAAFEYLTSGSGQ